MFDELRIWRVARTEDEIRATMDRRLTGREADLMADWRFDVNACDLSLNGGHGALQGAASIQRPGASLTAYSGTRAGPGSYAVTNVLAGRSYEVRAWLDADGNGCKDPTDPQGVYAGNPLPVTCDTNGIDIALDDGFDTDGDGLSDAYERGYGRYRVIAFTGTWADAQDDATNFSGYLATITSLDEWQDILRVVGGTNLYGRSMWIGGSDAAVEGAWRWVTGESWSYTRWAAGEPNNSGGNEDCAMLWASTGTNVQWSDWTAAGSNSWYLWESGAYTVYTNVDTDGDGLTDGYEVNTFGSSPVLLNTDGDAFTDMQEWIADTDPADPDDYLRIAGIEAVSSNILVYVQSSSNVTYALTVATGLVGSVSWNELPGIRGQGGLMPLTNAAPASAEYYRLRVTRP